MIKDLRLSTIENTEEYDLSDGVFARFESDNGTIELHLSDLEQHWQYANVKDVKDIHVQTDGKYVYAEFTTSSGQHAAFTVWAEDGKLVHIVKRENGTES